jgi:DNA-binding transcriptional regulator YdaS (Cro superfamily)
MKRTRYEASPTPSNATPSRKTLDEAISFAGSQGKLGVMCGISQNAIFCARQSNRVTAEMAVSIEKGTGGQFKREQFRPDLFKFAR